MTILMLDSNFIETASQRCVDGVGPDLENFEDRVSRFDPGPPPLPVEQFDLMRDQNASIIELSKQSPTLPIEGAGSESLARW